MLRPHPHLYFQVVMSYLSFLCARLLDLRNESRAARVIQGAWRKYRLKKQLQLYKVGSMLGTTAKLYRFHFQLSQTMHLAIYVWMEPKCICLNSFSFNTLYINHSQGGDRADSLVLMDMQRIIT